MKIFIDDDSLVAKIQPQLNEYDSILTGSRFDAVYFYMEELQRLNQYDEILMVPSGSDIPDAFIESVKANLDINGVITYKMCLGFKSEKYQGLSRGPANFLEMIDAIKAFMEPVELSFIASTPIVEPTPEVTPEVVTEPIIEPITPEVAPIPTVVAEPIIEPTPEVVEPVTPPSDFVTPGEEIQYGVQ